eukprot:11217423-Lingulodinium_polyedra.AAC.1
MDAAARAGPVLRHRGRRQGRRCRLRNRLRPQIQRRQSPRCHRVLAGLAQGALPPPQRAPPTTPQM